MVVFKGRACEPGAGLHCTEDFRRGGAPTPVRGTGVDAPPEAFLLKKPEAVWLGEDLLLEYEVSGQDA